MGKSCFDGYLTDGCKDCPDWEDGTEGKGLGCGTHYPIMHCEYFKRMYEEEEKREREERECQHQS